MPSDAAREAKLKQGARRWGIPNKFLREHEDFHGSAYTSFLRVGVKIGELAVCSKEGINNVVTRAVYTMRGG